MSNLWKENIYIYFFCKVLGYRRFFKLIWIYIKTFWLKMTEPIDDANNTKLIALKKFFIFNSKFGATEGEVVNYYHLNAKCQLNKILLKKTNSRKKIK